MECGEALNSFQLAIVSPDSTVVFQDVSRELCPTEFCQPFVLIATCLLACAGFA